MADEVTGEAHDLESLPEEELEINLVKENTCRHSESAMCLSIETTNMRSEVYEASKVSDSEQIIMIGEESDDEVDHDLNIKIVNYTVTQGVTEPDSIESGTDNAKCISKSRFSCIGSDGK